MGKWKVKINILKKLFIPLIVAVLMASGMSYMFEETAYAAGTAPCPGRIWREDEYSYVTGCSVCGGKNIPYSEYVLAADAKYGADSRCGRGYETRDETDPDTGVVWTCYYRCRNCGVTGKYTELLWRVVKSSPNPNVWKVGDREDFLGESRLAPGVVPWHHCTYCDNYTQSGGMNAHNTCYYVKGTADGDHGYVYISGNKYSGGIAAPNSTLTLNVVSKENYKFKEWNSGEKSDTVTLNVTSNISLTAYFEEAKGEPAQATPTPIPGTNNGAGTTENSSDNSGSSAGTKDKWYTNVYEYNYSTSAGNTIYNSISGGTVSVGTKGNTLSSIATSMKINTSYKIGNDSSGNTWYFIPSGSDATYVHPRTYGGYTVDSTGVSNITSLVFPSTITYGGTTYTVRTIGGGGEKYSTYVNESSSESSSSYNYTDWYGGAITGSYGCNAGSGQTGTSPRDDYADYNYGIGCVGNGYVYSSYGYQIYYTNTGYSTKYDNTRWYCFYNTTLKSITIPDTVTEILPYAFNYCQALVNVYGGANLQRIGQNAFSGERYINVQLSYTESSGSDYYYWKDSYTYYYDGSYSKTRFLTAMSNFAQNAPMRGTFKLPVFPKLRIIDSYAFSSRNTLKNVTLAGSISYIGAEAFGGCGLAQITIPAMNTNIVDSVKTLGTNGTGANRTLIVTDLGSSAMKYALKYNKNYRLQAGFSITYDPNGGNGTAYSKTTMVAADASQESGYKFVITTDVPYFTKANHVVKEWNTKPDGTGVSYSFGTPYTFTESTTLYAIWEKEYYKITYDSNGGYGSMPETKIYTDVKSGTLAANQFTKPGYAFTGWNTMPDGSGTSYADKGIITNVTGHMTLYARWERSYYNVTFMGESILVQPGTPLKSTEQWYYDEEHLITDTLPDTVYYISYDCNNESIRSNAVMGELTDKNTVSKLNFVCWSAYELVDGEFVSIGEYPAPGDVVSNITDKPYADIYLFPVYAGIKSYVTMPECTAKGYTLLGFAENKNETDTDYIYPAGAMFLPKGTQTLYAIWKPVSKTVTLDGCGADVLPQTSAVIKCYEKMEHVAVPVKDGFIFEGFYTKADGKGLKCINAFGDGCLSFLPEEVESIDILYAHWIPESMSITVTSVYERVEFPFVESYVLEETEGESHFEEWNTGVVFKEFGSTYKAVRISSRKTKFAKCVITIPDELLNVRDGLWTEEKWETNSKEILWEDGTYNEASGEWSIFVPIFDDGKTEEEYLHISSECDSKGFPNGIFKYSASFYDSEGTLLAEFDFLEKMTPYSVWKDWIRVSHGLGTITVE